MQKIDNLMSVKFQDILLAEGYNPSQFKYIKTSPSDIVFRYIPSNKNVYIRY